MFCLPLELRLGTWDNIGTAIFVRRKSSQFPKNALRHKTGKSNQHIGCYSSRTLRYKKPPNGDHCFTMEISLNTPENFIE